MLHFILFLFFIKDGYLARFQQKLQEKPGVKKYTIKDYRNLKKEIEIKEATDTGKLGFDAQNENYRRKAEITAKKNEYAEKVKARNRLLINERNRKENSPQFNTLRPRTVSPLEPIEGASEGMAGKTLVRIRDPVTGQIKKLYITDVGKEDLNKKQEMKKVHSFVSHQSRVSVKSDSLPNSDILNEFYKQEHVQVFKDTDDYNDFIRCVENEFDNEPEPEWVDEIDPNDLNNAEIAATPAETPADEEIESNIEQTEEISNQEAPNEEIVETKTPKQLAKELKEAEKEAKKEAKKKSKKK